MRFRDRPVDLRRLRPRRSLFWQALSGMLAFLLPISAVLYFLTVPDGPWILVVVMQLVVIGAFIGSYVSYRHVGFWVGASGIAERGFFGLSRYVPREEIGSIVLVNTYRPGGLETVPQPFICDTAGAQLMRMRGQFWSLSRMNEVRDALDMPITVLADDLTAAELLEDHPGLLYWFERHPLIIIVATLGAAAAAALITMIVFQLSQTS